MLDQVTDFLDQLRHMMLHLEAANLILDVCPHYWRSCWSRVAQAIDGPTQQAVDTEQSRGGADMQRDVMYMQRKQEWAQDGYLGYTWIHMYCKGVATVN